MQDSDSIDVVVVLHDVVVINVVVVHVIDLSYVVVQQDKLKQLLTKLYLKEMIPYWQPCSILLQWLKGQQCRQHQVKMSKFLHSYDSYDSYLLQMPVQFKQ